MALAGDDAEFPFELRICRWAERSWPPETHLDDDCGVLVARQLGTKRRRWDTVLVEVDLDGLAERRRFGERALDSDLLHVVRNAPAEWTWYRDALPDPGYPWRYVREAIHRADDRDVIETRKRSNRIQLRRVRPYPDWVRRIVAVENKPDLDRSAARQLREQLEHDVAMALADEVWVATAATDERIEPVVLSDAPVEAGQLVFDPTTGSAAVTWQPRSLAVGEPGTRILERPAGGPNDHSAARFEYADPAWKAGKRIEIAERAYERGWRSYLDTMRPDCRQFDLRRDETDLLPYCRAKDRCMTPAECGSACPAFEPEPPAWRRYGWPIEGGPGKSVRRLLERRRERARPE